MEGEKLICKLIFKKIRCFRTENGSEFHKYFRDYLKKQNITHYWNYSGRPYRQGHIEKFNRTIQEEFIGWNEILLDDTNKFNQKMTDWLVYTIQNVFTGA